MYLETKIALLQQQYKIKNRLKKLNTLRQLIQYSENCNQINQLEYIKQVILVVCAHTLGSFPIEISIALKDIETDIKRIKLLEKKGN